MTNPRDVHIRLPWLKPPLTLNSRDHWASKARKTRAARGDVAALLRAHRVGTYDRVRVQLGYTPRDARRRDTDNLVATLKAVCDACVDAGLVPDDIPAWMAKPEPIITEPDCRDPHLWLELTEIGDPPEPATNGTATHAPSPQVNQPMRTQEES